MIDSVDIWVSKYSFLTKLNVDALVVGSSWRKYPVMVEYVICFAALELPMAIRNTATIVLKNKTGLDDMAISYQE